MESILQVSPASRSRTRPELNGGGGCGYLRGSQGGGAGGAGRRRAQSSIPEGTIKLFPEEEDEEPRSSHLQKSPDLWDSVLGKLRSQDNEWEEIVDGFQVISRWVSNGGGGSFTKWPPGFLKKVIWAGLPHLGSQRTKLSRAACQCFKVLYEMKGGKGEGMGGGDGDRVFQRLLDLCGGATANKFIREESKGALLAAVENLEAGRVVGLLETFGAKHRNGQVKEYAAFLLGRLVERVGVERVVGGKEMAGRVIPMIVGFLMEAGLQTRFNAETCLSKIYGHPEFQTKLKRYVPPHNIRSVQETLKKMQMAGGGGASGCGGQQQGHLRRGSASTGTLAQTNKLERMNEALSIQCGFYADQLKHSFTSYQKMSIQFRSLQEYLRGVEERKKEEDFVMQNEYKKLQEREGGLLNELSVLKSTVGQKETENEGLKAQLRVLKGNCKELEEEMRRNKLALKNAATDFSASLSGVNEVVKEKDDKIGELERKLEVLKAEVNERKDRNDGDEAKPTCFTKELPHRIQLAVKPCLSSKKIISSTSTPNHLPQKSKPSGGATTTTSKGNRTYRVKHHHQNHYELPIVHPPPTPVGPGGDCVGRGESSRPTTATNMALSQGIFGLPKMQEYFSNSPEDYVDNQRPPPTPHPKPRMRTTLPSSSKASLQNEVTNGHEDMESILQVRPASRSRARPELNGGGGCGYMRSQGDGAGGAFGYGRRRGRISILVGLLCYIWDFLWRKPKENGKGGGGVHKFSYIKTSLILCLTYTLLAASIPTVAGYPCHNCFAYCFPTSFLLFFILTIVTYYIVEDDNNNNHLLGVETFWDFEVLNYTIVTTTQSSIRLWFLVYHYYYDSKECRDCENLLWELKFLGIVFVFGTCVLAIDKHYWADSLNLWKPNSRWWKVLEVYVKVFERMDSYPWVKEIILFNMGPDGCYRVEAMYKNETVQSTK